MARYVDYCSEARSRSRGEDTMNTIMEHPIASAALVVATGYTIGMIVGAFKGVPVGSLIQITVRK